MTFTPTDTTDYRPSTAIDRHRRGAGDADDHLGHAGGDRLRHGAVGGASSTPPPACRGPSPTRPPIGTVLGAGIDRRSRSPSRPPTPPITPRRRPRPRSTWRRPRPRSPGRPRRASSTARPCRRPSSTPPPACPGPSPTRRRRHRPGAGNGQTLSVTFTPTDTTDYTTATATTTINVAQATPTITWADPGGHRPTARRCRRAQLDATASVPGDLHLLAAAGTVLAREAARRSRVTFTPTDTTDYTTAHGLDHDRRGSGHARRSPGRLRPGIAYGTPLSAAQLDATASVPGTFAYSPAAGTVLQAGSGQTLSVTFTPTDTTDYTHGHGDRDDRRGPGHAHDHLGGPGGHHLRHAAVGRPARRHRQRARDLRLLPAAGTVLRRRQARRSRSPSRPPTPTDYTTRHGHDDDQRGPGHADDHLGRARRAITYGTALSADQLDATASVPGTFTYSPPLAPSCRPAARRSR